MKLYEFADILYSSYTLPEIFVLDAIPNYCTVDDMSKLEVLFTIKGVMQSFSYLQEEYANAKVICFYAIAVDKIVVVIE